MEGSTELEIRTPEELTALLFEGPETEVYEDPAEVQRRILERIFSAQSPEELRRLSKADPWQEHLDEPIRVNDVRFRRGQYDEGAAVFAVVDATNLETGEALTLTCGGMNVLATLMQHNRMGWLPWSWRLVKPERKTAAGYQVLWLDDSGLEQIAKDRATPAAG